MESLNLLTIIANDIYLSLGPGYNEVVYHRAFEVALRQHNISYASEVITPVFYKGVNVGHGRVDIMINNNFIIELKAINTINDSACIQIKNYMKHYSISEGLIVNFGQSKNKIDMIYIQQDNIFNYTNGIFVPSTNLNI